MRLKQIKLAGFKSFVDATTVPFPDQMTAIVGPNGCGKSNVIDAVRWVLGESSAKNLRGDAMTDVIFNGSTNRKPVSVASVELVFDNSEGKLKGNFADRTEISVKRQVNKEAQSTYFLNGSKCRRRDITDIFLGTGLGPRSYAIIEQGMISRLIESKPQELRIFIEEAAGISKYKERRKETENRIRHTRDNLERLEDVREELGTQLDKLKRQAATARRFKELKAAERKYKSELYALKWYRYNEQFNFHEKQRLEKETELESFISEQRGGELGLLKLKEQLQDCSDKVADKQKQVYQLGNDITRTEQQIIYNQEKHRTLADQQQQLNETLTDSLEHIELETEQFEELTCQIEEMAPQLEVVEQQMFQAQEQLFDYEQQLHQWQSDWQTQQQQTASSRQSAQVLQTKLHGQQTLLAKLQQRETDIDKELLDVVDVHMQENIKKASIQCELTKEQQLQVSDETAEQQELITHWQQQHEVLFEQKQQSQTLLTKLETQVQSLKEWHHEYQQSSLDKVTAQLEKHNLTHKGLLVENIDVSRAWQGAIEVVLSHIGTTHIIDEHAAETLTGQFITNDKAAKVKGSIAEVIESDIFPSWFNQIAAATDVNDAKQLLGSGNWSSVLTQTGQWLSNNWSTTGLAATGGEQNALQKLQQLQQLNSEFEQAQIQHQQFVEKQEKLNADGERLNQTLAELNVKQQQLNVTLHEHTMQLSMLQQQQQQQVQLQQRLNNEKQQLAEQIEQLQLEIESLEYQHEMSLEQDEEFNIRLQQLEDQKEPLTIQVQQAKSAVEQYKSQHHQFQLQQQGLNNQASALQQNISRAQTHQQQLQQELDRIKEQLSSADEPDTDLQAELELLMVQKLEHEQDLVELQTEQADVAEQISVLEQGQSGILHKLDAMRSEIENIKLESEGARVRSLNMLETLNDLEMPIKGVLETMSEEAEEEEWAEKVEKTTNSIQRLGAINLAAIEEHEIQAERKEYLDTQFQDLVDALETLESAIRKIDRESKAKFKETYDQVNGDLQMLFPKVFGGGSAYLELTSDDLLETGVTIMARPPGKKNSTIHLLSGGEKALTALSLVFSIFRLNPAPFCMLDEVDAPLDDANVGRFCKLVKEMSESVQFIYISHNKVAMEMASHLTGVTMQEPGVSRLVAVDVQQAVAMADA